MKTADELAIEGKQWLDKGAFVVFLYSSQEWMAVKMQIPFMRCGKMPVDELSAHTIRPGT